LLFNNKVPARKFKYSKVDQFAHGAIYEAKVEEADRTSAAYVEGE